MKNNNVPLCTNVLEGLEQKLGGGLEPLSPIASATTAETDGVSFMFATCIICFVIFYLLHFKTQKNHNTAYITVHILWSQGYLCYIAQFLID